MKRRNFLLGSFALGAAAGSFSGALAQADLLPSWNAGACKAAILDFIARATAPGADGIVRRIEVGARDTGSRPNWIVFALTNDTDEQIERLLVAPHFRLQGSGVIWPVQPTRMPKPVASS